MPPSVAWRRRIDAKAKEMLLTDEETSVIFERFQKEKHEIVPYPVCLLCQEKVFQVFPMNGCMQHGICADCTEHAAHSEIKTCSFCPTPSVVFDIQCPVCQVQFLSDSLQTICPNKHEFHVKLLRIWKRGPHTYTNYLKDEEIHWIKKEMEEFPMAVHCPTCRTPLERSSACNELYHCGHECICNACGQFSFRWEEGLQEHRKESGCSQHVDFDSEMKCEGEGECIHKRKKQWLETWLT